MNKEINFYRSPKCERKECLTLWHYKVRWKKKEKDKKKSQI